MLRRLKTLLVSKIRAVLIFGTLLVPLLGTATQEVGAQEFSFEFGGRERFYLVHLPPDYSVNTAKRYPLILAFHGGVGSSANLQVQSQLSAKADTASVPFVVVYPNGVQSLLGIRTWNAGGCCGFARDNDINDVGFVAALIDSLLVNFRISDDQIYATGLSNGGMMAYRLAAELPDRFAAIAPVAASLVRTGALPTNLNVPVIHFHSFMDEIVPLLGGVGMGGLSDHHNPPADSALTAWSVSNHCSGAAETVFDDPTSFQHRRWTGCPPGAEVELYVSYDGGHSWPGGRKTVIGDPVSTAMNANDLMWTFFQAHAKPIVESVQPGVDPSVQELWGATNYPNPMSGRTVISWVAGRSGWTSISVYDLLGRRADVLVMRVTSPGRQEIVWSPTEGRGIRLPAGIYFYRIAQGRQNATGTLVIAE